MHLQVFNSTALANLAKAAWQQSDGVEAAGSVAGFQ